MTLKLRRIGLGTWALDGTTKRLITGELGLELWRTKITKGGRIVWQVRGLYIHRRQVRPGSLKGPLV